MVYTLTWYVVEIGPYVLLASGGIYLWSRDRSVAALLVLIGFSVAVLGQIAAAYVSAQLGAAVDSTEGISTVMRKFQGWEWFTHYLGPIGIWVAAAGFFHGATGPVTRKAAPRQAP